MTRALTVVRASGVRSWGLDLIAGLPLLRRATWADTVRAAVAASPHHVSVYVLQVEAGTAFGRWYTPGAHPLPADDDAADMLRDAHALLTDAGCVLLQALVCDSRADAARRRYEHYEVRRYWSATSVAATQRYFAFAARR